MLKSKRKGRGARKGAALAALAAFLTTGAQAEGSGDEGEGNKPAAHRSPHEIIASAPAKDWLAVKPDDLLIMTLAPAKDGTSREVIIQLIAPPFSQGWVENIRKLSRAHWYDGNAITRVQDNYVVQWGDPNGEDEAKAKPLPDGLKVMDEACYVSSPARAQCGGSYSPREAPLSASAAGQASDLAIASTQREGGQNGWHERDSYASWVDIDGGWPVAADEIAGENSDGEVISWPVHCYGMVGVGRGMPPDTGSGAELYTVIGHAPRHLDRNIALVGRIIEGMEHLTSLPRGTGELGFYEDPGEHVSIQSVRLASELPADARPQFQYLNTESLAFNAYIAARANRGPPFFIAPAGGVDICNVPIPVRRAP